MKVTFPSVHFKAMIDKVAGVTGDVTSNEILKHILIQANDAGVAMVGTDSELSAIARSTDPKVEEQGVCVLSASQLRKISSLCGDEVVLLASDSQAMIVSDATQWDLAVMDHTLYPAVPSADDSVMPVPRERLLQALEAVCPAMGMDESRPSLMMVWFGSDGLYATDGSRAHFAVLQNQFEGVHIPAPAVRPLIELIKTAPSDYVMIGYNASYVMFLVGVDEFASRLLDQEFPTVRGTMIAPRLATHTTTMDFDRERLMLALRRAGVTAEEGTGIVSLQINGARCAISAQNLKGDRTVTTIEVGSYSGVPRSVSYSISSLLETIEVVKTDTIRFRMSSSPAEGSLLITNPDFTAVVLPRSKSN